MSNRLVYSTDQGKTCPDCQLAINKCNCRSKAAVASGAALVTVSRSTKGRKGAGVTLVSGFEQHTELKSIAKSLRQRCSSGGSIKDGVIEIQGDHRSIIKQLLESQGHTVKLSGG